MGNSPVSFLNAAAPGIAEGVFGILGGLLAPSQKKKFKWEREHLSKLTDQRLASINKSMKPGQGYFNFAQGAPQMSNMLNQMLASKAAMYYGGAGAPWATAMSSQVPYMTATPQPRPTNSLPAWARSV